VLLSVECLPPMRKCGVIGAGYVGLPLSIRIADVAQSCVVYDTSSGRVGDLRCGQDTSGLMPSGELLKENLHFSADEDDLAGCDTFFVCVPTPADNLGQIDLSHLVSASRSVGKHLTDQSIVVFESTVFPGCTEEVCVPILEECSGLKLNRDFMVGYSPERVSPGMTGAELSNITKLVSGSSERALIAVENIYSKIVDADVVRVPSIKVAEMSKVFENTQRDVNIALVNELSQICSELGLDTSSVLDAASTKWNFTRFNPGLVGGHCISIDPYYLIYKSVSCGYVPRLISEARLVNESMSAFVVDAITKELGRAGVSFDTARVGVMGITYKPDVPDVRNSKVVDLIRRLRNLVKTVLVCDCVVRLPRSLPQDIELIKEKELRSLDVLVAAVPHKSYAEMDVKSLRKKCSDKCAIFVDIGGVYDRSALEKSGFKVIRL